MAKDLRVTDPLSLAIVGAGKIARDSHMPAIAASDRFGLAAIVDPTPPDVAVPVFGSLEELLRAGLAIDAVAICTPPQVRAAIVRDAVAAGLHVLMEKPPAATLSEVAAIEEAVRPDRTVFAAWHSRHARMIGAARAWLEGRAIRAGRLVWREDAHRWHPGQHWLWQPGGMGVFDPTINAFSILTAITDAPWTVARADMQVPQGLDAPISAQLLLRAGAAEVEADLHFHDDDTAQWTILLDTDGGRLELRDGGARMLVDGAAMEADGGACGEYDGVYRRFADLIDARRSDIDVRPLRLVADAFLIARTTSAPPFAP